MSGWVPPSSTGPTAGQAWTPPGAPGPVVGWTAPEEPEGLGVRESLGEGWRLTRANLGSLATIAFIPEVLRNLLLLPLWLLYGRIIADEIRFFVELDFTRYRTDPQGIQRDLAAIFAVSSNEAIAIAIGGTLSIIVMVVGFGAISAGTIQAAEGRKPSFAAAWDSVTEHLWTLLAPAVILALLWAVVGVPLLINQGASMGGGSTGSQFLGSLIGLGVFAGSVILLFIAIRWVLAYQVVLVEDLSLVMALRRSASLTAGARTRIGLAFIALWFVVGLIIGVVGWGVAIVAWLATGSAELGVIGFAVVLTISGFVYMPWIAATLTYIYRLRVGPSSRRTPGLPRASASR